LLRLALALLLALRLGAAWSGEPSQRVEWPLEARMHAAASYLHAQIGSSGKMVYLRSATTAQPIPSTRYNLLRHAGTLLALAEYHAEFAPSREQRIAIQAAFGFLRSCCLRPSRSGANDLALWSEPEVIGGQRSYPVAKLGGAGLALAAMARWRPMDPDGVQMAEMQALGNFILSMQRSDGLFQSLHALDEGEHDPAWVSLYYPGEAALGLVLLHELDGDTRWLEGAVDALLALAREREGQAVPPPDHWALVATAQLQRVSPAALQAALPKGFSWQPANGILGVEPLLTDHALAVAQGMVAEQRPGETPVCAQGGFGADGRTTPAATRLEGLLALLAFLSAGERHAQVHTAVEAGMRFLLDAQLRNVPVKGAFSRVTPSCFSADPRASEIRIDYVQHALAAMQAYRALRRASRLP
jgi:hypothetical protein